MNALVAQQIRTVAEARMRELAPALTELEQLQSVLAALEESEAAREGPGEPPRLPKRPLAAVRRGHKRGRDGRAPQGANKQSILAVIDQNPGIAAPQIAKLTGLRRPLVASTISRLKRTGELEPHGDGVRLPATAPAERPLSFLAG